MNIITIGREFGSGGRELGKRLAEELGFAYYDKQILNAIAEETKLDASYISRMTEVGGNNFSYTFGNSFSYPTGPSNTMKILLAQRNILERIAQGGKDFVVVGRNADIFLKDYHPLNIFVYADLSSRVARCRQRASDDENLTDKQLEKKILKIDKTRAKYRELITFREWGKKEYYHLCVNASGFVTKDLVPYVASFARLYFEKHGQTEKHE